MHPVLFHIGDFAVHTYGVMGGLSFLVGASLVLWRARALGVAVERAADLIFWLAVLSLAGARLVFVLQNPGVVETLPQLLDVRSGGLVFYGSFLVGFPLGFLLMHRWDMPAFAMWDTMATAFPLSHAISRVGCYAAGCCYGVPTEGALGVTFPPGGLAPAGVPLHPVQLYEAGVLLLIGVACNLFYARRRFDGQVMLLYLSLYAFARAGLEVLRGDAERGSFMPTILGDALSWSQGMSLLLALVAVGVFFVGARRAGAPEA